ncbi:diaminopimelate epimerase [Roseinatronobacter alkalisoli]|uniref:Diaminopimelate epimerase n=1 Tax=Roseinatronobacter alkalisoli TaxID=3028235 RepID=A0ABT5T3I2_9RHOB|nr:diaminopimelate epimerase [Roseinatronobacter sp. HJB301]MDD7969671.1 diaminopimelate epimerase [Roseinatronobacter sp. HJB301]
MTDVNAPLAFVKMHGAGNDFVIIDSMHQADGVMTTALAAAIGDRHRGVGFDQLAELRQSDAADLDLDFWNADGSRAGACGNATRCVADMVMTARGLDRLRIRTARGILVAENRQGQIWVNMGAPLLDWQDIPLAHACDTDHLPIEGDPAGVGMGNPHCVFFVADADAAPVAALGRDIEHHALFPQATNVEFASVTAPDHLRLRVWERGTGITLACGSGACATAVAAHRRGLTGRRVRIDADGGQLLVDWRDDGVWLSGPVAHVFDATLSAEFIAAHR